MKAIPEVLLSNPLFKWSLWSMHTETQSMLRANYYFLSHSSTLSIVFTPTFHLSLKIQYGDQRREIWTGPIHGRLV